MLAGIQRLKLIKSVSAFGTVSTKVLQIITDMKHILVLERKRLYDRSNKNISRAKREERDHSIQIWQKEWDRTTNKSTRTKSILPDIGN